MRHGANLSSSLDDLMAPDPEEANVFRPLLSSSGGNDRSVSDSNERGAFWHYVAGWERDHGGQARKQQEIERRTVLHRAAPLLQQEYDALENKFAYFDLKRHAEALRHAAVAVSSSDHQHQEDPVESARRNNKRDIAILHEMAEKEAEGGRVDSLPLRLGLTSKSTTSIHMEAALHRSRPCCSHLVQKLLAEPEEYERSMRASPGKSSVAFEIPSPSRKQRSMPINHTS